MGDIVRVREDLEVRVYDRLGTTVEMMQYRGKSFEIENIRYGVFLYLKGIRNYAWNDAMVEPYCEEIGGEFDIPYDTPEINTLLKSGVNFLNIFTYE